MQIRRRTVIAALFATLAVTACQLDSRKQAVNEIVDFALSSPFTMMPNDGASGNHLAIADTALDDFNRIFDYLPKSDNVDSARFYYNHWMANFLGEASFSAVEDLSFSLEADTLIATVAVTRPELHGFDRTVLSRLGSLDSAQLNSRVDRAKRELQIRDTLLLKVVAGPRVVAWSSAVNMRAGTGMEVAPPSVAMVTAPETENGESEPKGATPAVNREALNLVDPGDSTINLWITANANVREGPGMDHDILTSRPMGTRLVADSLVEGWYHVSFGKGDVEGFISGTLVSTDTVSVPPTTREPRRDEETQPARETKAARSET